MKMKLLLALLPLVLGLQQSIVADHHSSGSKKRFSEWSRWGHDNKNSMANLQENQISRENVGNLVQRWNFVLPSDDRYQVQPIIVDNLMYLLSVEGFLYVVNTQTGTFDTQFNGGQRLFVGSKNNSNAGSTPVVHGSFIYTATDDLIVRSFNRFTGALNPNWPAQGVKVPVYPFTAEADTQAVIQSSLAIVGKGKKGRLFVSTSSLDEVSEISVQKGTQNAYDLHGKLLWSEVIAGANNDAIGVGCWSTPSFDTKRKLMFFGTSNPQMPPAGPFSDALQARDYRTGKLVWNYQYVANDVSSIQYPFGIGNPIYMIDKDVGASPNVFDVKRCSRRGSKHLVGANGKDGIYRAFDRKSGALQWSTTLTLTPSVDTNPTAAFAKGVLYTVYPSDIDPKTQVPNPPFSPFYGNAYATPAVRYDDIIKFVGYGDFAAGVRFFGGILTSNAIVTALDAATGSIKWQQSFPTVVFGGPVYANGVVYIGFYDGTLRALDARNGNVLATYLTPPSSAPPGFPIPLPANQTIPSPATVVNGMVFVPYENAILPGNTGVFALGLP